MKICRIFYSFLRKQPQNDDNDHIRLQGNILMQTAVFIRSDGFQFLEAADENVLVGITECFSDGFAGQGSGGQQFFGTLYFLFIHIFKKGDSEVLFKVLRQVIWIHAGCIGKHSQVNVR